MQKKDYRAQFAEAVDKLRDPFRMRIAVMVGVVAMTYFGVYSPLAEQISKKQKTLKLENKKSTLAQDIEFLESQAAQINDRLPKDSDTNEFAQYVLSAIRSRPLTLVRLEPGNERRSGALSVVVLRLEVRGEVHDLDNLLEWIERNERVFRIDTLKVNSTPGVEDRQLMQLTLLGLNA